MLFRFVVSNCLLAIKAMKPRTPIGRSFCLYSSFSGKEGFVFAQARPKYPDVGVVLPNRRPPPIRQGGRALAKRLCSKFRFFVDSSAQESGRDVSVSERWGGKFSQARQLAVCYKAGHKSPQRSTGAHVDCLTIRPISLQCNRSAMVLGDWKTIMMSHGQNMTIDNG